MRDFLTHWEDFGRLPPQDALHTDGTATTEGIRWEVGVSPAGGGNDVGGVTGGGDPRLPPIEHNHAVHRNQDHYGTVSGGTEPTGDKGVQAVVGAGISGLDGDAYGGSRDRTGG